MLHCIIYCLRGDSNLSSTWYAGLLLLVSPFESIAIENIKSANISRCILSFFAVSLTSTLAGQISGSLVAFVFIASPPNAWLVNFEFLAVQYPAERIVLH